MTPYMTKGVERELKGSFKALREPVCKGVYEGVCVVITPHLIQVVHEGVCWVITLDITLDITQVVREAVCEGV
jgi:SMC interacting uncharacterized protein involved in chromosome segregation